MNRINAISFYKGVAIMLVIMIHVSQRFCLVEPFSSITKFGDLGCQIFFTISAFCLCLSFENRQESYMDYLKRRIIRIAPGYWLTIVLSVSLALGSLLALGKNVLGVSLKPLDIAANVVLVNGLCPPQSANNHVVRGGWFVGTLVILYALFPLLYKLFKKIIIKPYIAFLICFLFFVLNASFWYIFDSLGIPGVFFNRTYFFYFSFLNQLPSFVCGIYMFSIYEKNKKEQRPKTCYFFLFALFFCLLCFFKYYSNYEYNSIYIPYLVGLSFVYLFELTRRMLERTDVCSRTIMNVGNNSFGMYLLNTFIAWEMGVVVNMVLSGYSDTLAYLIWLPISITILYLLSIYYEKIISLFSKLIFK